MGCCRVADHTEEAGGRDATRSCVPFFIRSPPTLSRSPNGDGVRYRPRIIWLIMAPFCIILVTVMAIDARGSARTPTPISSASLQPYGPPIYGPQES